VDVLTTVTAFTAQSIAKGIEQWITPHHEVSEIIISGGGLHNKTLMHFLAEYLVPTIKIHPIDNFGIPADAKESLAFAILANEAISGNANNAPHATGAKEPVIMGKIVPG